NLDDLEKILDEGIFNKISPDETLCSRVLCKKIGNYLLEESMGRGILQSAAKNNVPVYIPAFTDCELGLDFALYNRKQVLKGNKSIKFNPFLDLDHFSDLILKQKSLGIFTIGGGVPRNWAQQVGPYLDFIRFSIRDKEDKSKYHAEKGDPYNKAYKYAVRICPEPVEWGGLSGCTYTEGVTWGKFRDEKTEGGLFAEVLTDATYVWPLLIKAVQDRLKKEKITIKKSFKNENI
ncbi:deoxyhypusine synthase family protein, partial [Patescibacteria group bacterium]|nr:deoxyhypusine synthase family protein [Patescibacteria group bacterium]